MNQPIRWAENDPVEALVFDALLLSAEIAGEQDLSGLDLSAVVIGQVDREELLANSALLSQVFGLLVLAHYRTRPNDLRQLLDSKALNIYVMRFDGLVLGTVLLLQEGGLDSELLQQVYEGRRRLRGQMLPQSLAAHVGMRLIGNVTFGRVMRIAIHPQLQRNGLGSRLLQYVVDDAKKKQFDVVGTSFGVTKELLKFWQQIGFEYGRIGLMREHSSGCHSLMLLLPITDAGRNLCVETKRRFYKRLPLLLADQLADLDVGVAIALMRGAEIDLAISNYEWDDLNAFADSNLALETVIAPLYQLVCHYFSLKNKPVELTHQQQTLLMCKLMQKQSWAEVCVTTGCSGKNQAMAELRLACAKLILLRN